MTSPSGLAELIAALDRPTLIVFDCDGVLAPLTDHADNSVLSPGVGNLLTRLAEATDVDLAILSGRSLDGLAQFDFAETITVTGSYGGERRGQAVAPLTDDEAALLAEAEEILTEAQGEAGQGAWVERKPTSMVLHVREADPELGAAALATVWQRQAQLVGHECHEGSNVVEIMARPADKGRGLTELRSDFDPASVVYFGDDVPDEDAFALLETGDLGVKVGPGDTAASERLDDHDAVIAMLVALVECFEQPRP